MTKKELISKTAKAVLDKMDNKNKKELLKHEPIMFHFTLGLHIRNKYIYNHPEFDDYEPDGISQDIIEEMQKIVKGE